jgi:hypothetical protein
VYHNAEEQRKKDMLSNDEDNEKFNDSSLSRNNFENNTHEERERGFFLIFINTLYTPF